MCVWVCLLCVSTGPPPCEGYHSISQTHTNEVSFPHTASLHSLHPHTHTHTRTHTLTASSKTISITPGVPSPLPVSSTQPPRRRLPVSPSRMSPCSITVGVRSAPGSIVPLSTSRVTTAL